MKAARLLVQLLREPAGAAGLSPAAWTDVLTVAHAEALGGALADRLAGTPVPSAVERLLSRARDAAEASRRDALWEAEMARRALAGTGIMPILLKGTAYAAAGLDAAAGRQIGDLDLLVARDELDRAEAALRAAGWELLKTDAYDDAYYRRWMHELPPLIHATRDRIVDVHHTILPPTARPKPRIAAMLEEAVTLAGGTRVLAPVHMVIHSAAHLFADGDLSGGLRNLWDIDRLVRQFCREDEAFVRKLVAEAARHELRPPVLRALRLAGHLFGTPVPADCAPGGPDLALRAGDRLFVRRLLARDGWGRGRLPLTRLGFYIRSHWLRMPPHLLARHLWVKATRRGA